MTADEWRRSAPRSRARFAKGVGRTERCSASTRSRTSWSASSRAPERPTSTSSRIGRSSSEARFALGVLAYVAARRFDAASGCVGRQYNCQGDSRMFGFSRSESSVHFCRAAYRLLAVALACGAAALGAQESRAPAPPGDVIGVGNFAHIVANVDESLKFYHDVLGLEVRVTQGFAPNPAIEKLGHTEGGQSRIAVVKVPGIALGIELIEYKDIAREPQRPRFFDPGAANFAMRVRDLDALFPKVAAFPGVKIITAGGKPSDAQDAERHAARRVRARPGRLRRRDARRAESAGGRRARGERLRIRGDGREQRAEREVLQGAARLRHEARRAIQRQPADGVDGGRAGRELQAEHRDDPGHVGAVHADRVQEHRAQEVERPYAGSGHDGAPAAS